LLDKLYTYTYSRPHYHHRQRDIVITGCATGLVNGKWQIDSDIQDGGQFSVVICDVLCFLRHKFGKTVSKVVKSALVDFYDGEVLSNAKSQ